MTEGKDVLSLLVAKSKTQTALQMQAMAALEQHTSNLRAVVAEAELAQNDDNIGDVRNRLESVISSSEAHQDGAKLMFKRLKPLV